MISSIHKYWLLCLSMIVVTLFLPLQSGFEFDIYCWRSWATYIAEHGLGHIYESWANYPPVYLYILKGFTFFFNTPSSIDANIHVLKYITLIFHSLLGYILMIWIKPEIKNNSDFPWIMLVYLLNVSILYNGMIWGQVDIIQSFFLFVACYVAYQQKIEWTIFWILLSLNFKVQSIIYIPVLLIMLAPVVLTRFNVANVSKWFSIIVLVQTLLLLPFIFTGNVSNFFHTMIKAVDTFPILSANAFNFWWFFYEWDSLTITDQKTLFGITYKSWGLLMFVMSSLAALFPLLKQSYLHIKHKRTMTIDLSFYLLICALIPLLFFFFNTQMHERYSHPFLPFLTAYAIIRKKYLILFLGSLAYFLNLEHVLQFLHVDNYGTVLFDSRVNAALYGCVIALMFYDLYQNKTSTFINPKHATQIN